MNPRSHLYLDHENTIVLSPMQLETSPNDYLYSKQPLSEDEKSASESLLNSLAVRS